MHELTATIRNGQGIHCRPSAVIMKEAQKYGGTIRVLGENGECDCSSVIELLSLGLEKGAQIRIQCEGEDEESFCKKLVALFETEFDFPPRDKNAPPCV